MNLNVTEKAQAASIWDLISIVPTFRKVIRQHAKHTFLGFVNVVVEGRAGTPMAGFKLFLNDIEAKILPKGFYLEMPNEASRKGDGNYFDVYAPGSGVTRELITTAVLSDPTVKAAIEEAKVAQAPAPVAAPATPAATGTEYNPFLQG